MADISDPNAPIYCGGCGREIRKVGNSWCAIHTGYGTDQFIGHTLADDRFVKHFPSYGPNAYWYGIEHEIPANH